MTTLVCPLCRIALTAPERSCPRDGSAGVEHAFPALPAALAERFRVVMPFTGSESASSFVVDALDSGKRGLLKLQRRPESARDQELLRARRELEKQRKIDASTLVVPWLSGEVDGALWLFRRWLDGVSLRVVLARGEKPEPREGLALAAQLALAVDALHAHGLLHRDIHPGHVFLEARPGAAPRLQLLDAGLPNVSQRTDGPPLVGSAGYAAPEQRSGKLVSMRSDLYSAGAVIAEILQGTPVFPGDSAAQRAGAQERAPILTLSDTLAESVRGMVDALLSADPQRRPFSAQKLRRTLDAYLPEGVSVTRQPTTPFTTPAGSGSAPGSQGSAPDAAAQPRPGAQHDVRPHASAAPPPPPPPAAYSRPPHPPTGRPSTRAPLPPPPRRQPEPDLTQALDEDLLEEVAPKATPPAPPARRSALPAKPARENEDYTVPVRLDQILTVSPTPRAPSAAPPPAPEPRVAVQAAPLVTEPVRAAPVATLPPPAAVLPAPAALPPASLPPLAALPPASLPPASLRPRAPAAHVGTLFDPATAEADATHASVAVAPTLPALGAPPAVEKAPEVAAFESSAAGHDEDAFAPVAPHKATALGLGAPPSLADVPAEQDDTSASDLSADVTTLMPRTTSSQPPSFDEAASGVSTASAYQSGELPADEVTQPVRELSSSLRPPGEEAQRKRQLVYGLAAAAALLLGFGVRAMFGGDDTVEAGKTDGAVAAAVASESAQASAPSAPAPAQGAQVTALPMPSVTDLNTGKTKTTLPEVAVAGPTEREKAEEAARRAAESEAKATAEAELKAAQAEARAAEARDKAAAEAEAKAAAAAAREERIAAAKLAREEKAEAAAKARTAKVEAAKAAKAERTAKAAAKREKATPENAAAQWAAARDEAREHYAARRYQKAVEAYERATKADPQNPGTYAGLGAARLQTNNAKGAVDAYQHAVNLSPNTAGFHAALGRAYVAAGDTVRAKASYKRALALDPENQGIAKALADLG